MSFIHGPGLPYDYYANCLPMTKQKMKFPLRISSVNVTKYAVSSEFAHSYGRNP